MDSYTQKLMDAAKAELASTPQQQEMIEQFAKAVFRSGHNVGYQTGISDGLSLPKRKAGK